MNTFKRIMALVALSVPYAAQATCQLERDLLPLQQRWAEIQYTVPDERKAQAFEVLSDQARTLVAECPERAEPLIWEGIVLSTYAGAKGGLGALTLVRDARHALEQALALNESALEGSAHTSLGSLYYQVPGWPLSFGDDQEAERHLQKALALNPDGIDANYFYGDYLVDQGRPTEARVYLEHALAAPDRPGRALADEGRREDVLRLLHTVASLSATP